MAGLSALPPPAAEAQPGFFARRWRGRLALRALLWPEMLGWGTAVNLAFSGAALALLAAGVGAGWAVSLHFAPLPWNLFLVACVWRHPQAGSGSRGLGLAWLTLMLVL